MVDVLRDDTPTPTEQRIEELFVWVAIQPDGGEGIISLELAGTHMPLVTSKRHVAESYGPRVVQVVQSTPDVKAKLLHFKRVLDT